MQIEIKSPAVAAKWATVLWTVAMWLWLLIEAIAALGNDDYSGVGRGSVVTIESAHVLVLWFLVVIPLIAGTVYLKKQEAGAPTAESEDAAESSS